MLKNRRADDMEYSCREADGIEEKRQARTIVLAEYARSGYIFSEDARTDVPGVLPSDVAVASSSGVTLVIPAEGRIVGTVSVVLDSPDGFPMDSLYHTELEALRQSGHRLAEVVQLATDQEFVAGLPGIGGGISLLLPLFQGVLRIGKERGVDGFCITVNPKHDRFYTEIGFVPIGPERQYEALGGAPTLPKVFYWQSALEHPEGQSPLSRLLLDAV